MDHASLPTTQQHQQVATLVWNVIAQRFVPETMRESTFRQAAALFPAAHVSSLLVTSDFYCVEQRLIAWHWFHPTPQAHASFSPSSPITALPADLAPVLDHLYANFRVQSNLYGARHFPDLTEFAAEASTPGILQFIEPFGIESLLAGWLRLPSQEVWTWLFARASSVAQFGPSDLSVLLKLMAHLSVTAREWCLDLRGLTARECQILQTLSTGKPQKLCAAELGISPRTYEKQVESLRRKLGVTRTWEILPAVVARTRASFGA